MPRTKKVKEVEKPQVAALPKDTSAKATDFSYIVPPKESDILKSDMYDAKGIIKKDLKDDLAAALTFKAGANQVYKVKIGKNNKLYNPKNDGFGQKINGIDRSTKLPMFKFRPVNEKCFNFYISFLRKRFDSLLQEAERSI